MAEQSDRKREKLVAAILAAVASWDWRDVEPAAAPLIDDLVSAVSDRFGVSALDAQAETWRFVQQLRDYLNLHPDITGEDLRAYVELLVASELQGSQLTLAQQAAGFSGVSQVRRVTHPEATRSGPCPICLDLEGIHDADDPNAYYWHPYCACTIEPVGVEAMAEHRGNPQALRNWYDKGAASQINWGHAGDFDRCTEIAGKYMSVEQAHGFCQERHIDATGAPAGHAPGEKRDKKHSGDGMSITAAELDTRTVNDLPDSDFAYIEPGGTKDSEGKTTPRSKRHFPIHDAAHVRNALARASQSPFGPKALPKIRAAAKRMGIGEPAEHSEPDVSDMHVNAPVNSERPTRHFLKRMLDKLKGKVSAAEFDEAVRHARGHAGGMTRAANRRNMVSVGALGMPGAYSTEQFNYGWDSDNDSAYLPDSAIADIDGDNDADDGAQPKLEKADARVKYRDATEVTKTCGHCRFFWEDEGACRIVEGFIREDGVCNLFSPIVMNMAEDENGPEERFFSEPLFYMEPPKRIPYLPKPGTYTHPSYGQVVITRERNQRFLDNFRNAIYQERLPIDAEHQSKLSGACGWVDGMEMNEDGSVDALPTWTPRGETMLRNDAFGSFSPEFYDEWQDPATGAKYQDVAIGGALTTRPFFKSKSLRPLAASEHVLVGWFAPREERHMADVTHPFDGSHSHPHNGYGDHDDGADGAHMHDHSDDSDHDHDHTEAQMDSEQKPAHSHRSRGFAEELAALKLQNAALKKMTEQQAQESKRYGEVIAGMEKASRARQFTDEVLGRGDASNARWYGSVDDHVRMMETLHSAGLDEELKQYIELNRAHAEQLKTSGLFAEYGRAGTISSSAEDKLSAMVDAEMAKGVSVGDAMDKIMRENPQLYAEYSKAKSFNDGERG